MTSATFPHAGPPFPFLETQEWFFPPEVMDFTVRLGTVRESQHAQLEVNVRDGVTGGLIALGSIPHFWIVESRQVLTDLVEELLAIVSKGNFKDSAL